MPPDEIIIKSSILIADPDATFVESIKKDPKSKQILPITAGLAKEAQLSVASKTQRLVAIVISTKIESPNGLPLIRFCRVYRPIIPIFILYDGEPPFLEEEMKSLGIHSLIKKPVTFSQIVEIVAPNVIQMNPGQNSSQDEVPLGTEFSAEDSNFTNINAEDFMSGTKSVFDLFIKIGEQKYVKILNKYESLDHNRLRSYLEKGVRRFYLKNEAHAEYLAYCDRLASGILNSDKFSNAVKIKGTLTHGEETMSFFRTHGLNAGTLQYAGNFVNNVEQLARSSDLHKDKKILSFMNDFEKYDHAVAVTLISGLLGKTLQFDGERALKLLGLASLFHDIGLLGLPPEFQKEDESILTESQIKEFQNHPRLGADALSQLNIDTVVVQAVLQHHERRNKTGFPAQLGSGAINRIAEIIGISDEFIKLIRASKLNPYLGIYSEMEANIFPGFSIEVSEALQKTFFPGKI